MDKDFMLTYYDKMVRPIWTELMKAPRYQRAACEHDKLEREFRRLLDEKLGRKYLELDDALFRVMDDIAEATLNASFNQVEQLKAVGINATILPVEWESWVDETYTGRQFQSTVVGVDASNMTARALLERFTSTADDNFINYNNAEYDQLFAQAVATYDDAAQTELYKQMEHNLTANAANVYIQDLADLVAVRKGLEGVTFYPIYVLDLAGIHYTA